jgi:hypothetical protein
MKVFSFLAQGRSGAYYSVRLLLDDAELAALQAEGLVPAHTAEVVGMQTAADVLVAQFEREALVAGGGVVQ